jgi:hypothetical protein
MEIELKTSGLIAELSIKSGNTKITEDIAIVDKGVGRIEDWQIEKFISIAREMNLYNNKSDLEFVKMVHDAFLNDAEREEFLIDLVSA